MRKQSECVAIFNRNAEYLVVGQESGTTRNEMAATSLAPPTKDDYSTPKLGTYRTHHGTGYDVNQVEDFRVTFVFENYDAHSRKKNNDVHDEVPTLEIEIEIDNSSVLKVLRCPTKGLSRKQEPTFRMFSFGGFHVSDSFGQF